MTRKQKRIRAKILRTVIATVAFLGFLIVLGSAGALENDSISVARYFIQSAIGLAMLGVTVPIINECF